MKNYFGRAGLWSLNSTYLLLTLPSSSLRATLATMVFVRRTPATLEALRLRVTAVGLTRDFVPAVVFDMCLNPGTRCLNAVSYPPRGRTRARRQSATVNENAVRRSRRVISGRYVR